MSFHACHVIVNGVTEASYAFAVRGGENLRFHDEVWVGIQALFSFTISGCMSGFVAEKASARIGFAVYWAHWWVAVAVIIGALAPAAALPFIAFGALS